MMAFITFPILEILRRLPDNEYNEMQPVITTKQKKSYVIDP